VFRKVGNGSEPPGALAVRAAILAVNGYEKAPGATQSWSGTPLPEERPQRSVAGRLAEYDRRRSSKVPRRDRHSFEYARADHVFVKSLNR
jgi:hypothetical protein